MSRKDIDAKLVTFTIRNLISVGCIEHDIPIEVFDVGADDEIGVSLTRDDGKEFVFNVRVTDCTEK